jgi:hypothetical protein
MISLKFGYDLGISNTWDIYIYIQNIANCLSNGISTFQINRIYPTKSWETARLGIDVQPPARDAA